MSRMRERAAQAARERIRKNPQASGTELRFAIVEDVYGGAAPTQYPVQMRMIDDVVDEVMVEHLKTLDKAVA